MIVREKCKICQVIIGGDARDRSRHLRLKHNICIGRRDPVGLAKFYQNVECIDVPAVIRKSLLKKENTLDNIKRKRKLSRMLGNVESKSIFWGAVIKTPSGSK